MRKLLAGVFAVFTLVGIAHAQSDEGLLPVEQAFKLDAKITTPGTIALHWDIAPDYYLYRSRIKSKTSQPDVSLGAIALPDGEKKHDEFLGDVEVYHHSIDATLPYALSDSAQKTLAVTVTAQGCHQIDPKICYPPHPTTLTLAVPASRAAAAPMDAGAPGGATLSSAARTPNTLIAPSGATAERAPVASPFTLGAGSSLSAGADRTPLPAEQAFQFEAIAQSPTAILARWTMPKGYYLYRDKSSVALAEGAGDKLGAPHWPTGTDHQDEHFGSVTVYFDQVEVPIALARESGAAQTVKLHAEYQGCQDDGLCYPVMQRDVDVVMPLATPEQLAAAKATFVAAPPAAQSSSSDNAQRSQPPTPGTLGILAALLLALLGGLVLNLMPCVLPVLSLKVLGLAQSGESPAKARRHALYYTAGVLVAFSSIGLAVVALRAAGQALGWGFQLQQPVFVAVLVYILFAIGLSLSGVFNFGAGLAGVGQNLGSRSGVAGDFFTGVLAVVVASPCTAPFMGSALAYAFAASSAVALLVFLALGVGLALPFLAVGFVPALASRLPRPGAWMETFKQALAFPMYLTAAWLVWVLGNQRGIDAVGWVLVGAIVLALGLWWWEHSRYKSTTARMLAAAVLLAALWPIAQVGRLTAPTAAHATEAPDWVPYSAARLANLRAEGRGVFVDMGADWCVTCKVNERAVLDTDAFRDLLKRNNAILMKGDWTNVDPAITAFLQQYKAVGVPLYVVFRAGVSGNGQALPTVLTPGAVALALGSGAP
ncbi:MAG: protein-disulfide reductase DsbD [Dokdonella sp.]